MITDACWERGVAVSTAAAANARPVAEYTLAAVLLAGKDAFWLSHWSAKRGQDPRDAVQVKYEMVRRVRVEGVPVTQAARAFGYCRQAFYEIAAALDAGGPSALPAGKPGPKGPLKLTDPVMEQVEGWLAADPNLRSRDLAARVLNVFGFRVHPRSVERALGRRRETRDSPEPKTRP